VYYSIVAGNTMKNFTIDAVTGRVRPTFPIDFEKLPGNTHNGVRAMTMVIRAQDRGMPKPLFSEVSLVVYVHDVNDHAPRFEKLHYATTIPEDLSGGSPVIQVCMNIQYQSRKIIRCTFFLIWLCKISFKFEFVSFKTRSLKTARILKKCKRILFFKNFSTM